MGLLELGGSTNAKVKLIAEGLLSGLDTSTATAGDPVWLGTNGNLIYGLANKPVAPAHLVFIGVVTRSNSNNGEIFVKPQNGFELNELHDVLISSPATGEVIQRTASNLWENKTLEEAGIMPNVDAKLHRTNSASEGGQLDFARALDNEMAWGIDAFGSTSTPDLRFIEGTNTRVTFNAGGDLTLGGSVNASRIRLNPAVDLSATSTDHNFQIGETSSTNLRIDNNEIEVLTNGVGATLVLNGSGGGTVQFGGLLDSNDTYANEITTTRRAMWMSSAGVFGYASSSRERKQDITGAEINVDAVLEIEPKFFRYISAVEELGDQAPIELGMIAEDLHDAGLTQLVDYGKNGSIEGIHYSMYVTALQAVARHQATQIADLTARLEALEAK
jgi:hypothetical protein